MEIAPHGCLCNPWEKKQKENEEEEEFVLSQEKD